MFYLRFFCILTVFFVFASHGLSTDIKIGLFFGETIESFVFTTIEGEYILEGDNRQIAAIRKGSIFHIELNGSTLTVHDTVQSYGNFSVLAFKGISRINIFQVRPIFPALKSKESEGNLSAGMFDGNIHLINTLDLENYIPGSVETEGGSMASEEYYKAQAVIIRTFALRNFHRHAHEGFNLCDAVHCQAFNGKSRMNKQIVDATKMTEDEIMVDHDGKPVLTAFHANCGGTTASSSVIWNRDLYYLSPVNDPFCDKSTHRNWEKVMPETEWYAYLKSKGYNGTTPIQSSETRQKFLGTDNLLPLTEIRKDLKLKSSFFKIVPKEDKIIIKGHGYGHGLGLCQQGAMEMARVGFCYQDILMFYFKDLSLVKRSP